MKKFAIILIIGILSGMSLCALSREVFFPTKKTGTMILPSDSKIGQTANKTFSEENSYISKILTSEFNFEWTEENFSKDSAKALSSIYSEVLSKHIPASEFLMSKPLKNADGSVSISVRFTDNTTLTFVIKDRQICGMSL